jgi:TRAP-type C4-dicarboxylate transport system permease small subunit
MMVEEPEAKPAEDDEAGGFGGDFAAKPAADDEAAGFGGGFGGDFAGSTNEPAVPTPTPVPLEQAEPVELSATAQLVDAFVMAVKLEWIDVVLRHLVLVVGFLGAMLATQRRKHITIDALSKVLPQRLLPWTEALTSLLAAVICGFLASSGADLVAISREFPKELTAWADEWMFQLVFPVGFALLCFHFGVRVLESIGHGLQHAEQHVEQQGEA